MDEALSDKGVGCIHILYLLWGDVLPLSQLEYILLPVDDFESASLQQGHLKVRIGTEHHRPDKRRQEDRIQHSNIHTALCHCLTRVSVSEGRQLPAKNILAK